MTENLHVLLVEDSRADVFLVKEAIRQEGLICSLQVAEDGEAAMDLLNRVDGQPDESCPSLLLLDLNVPLRSGNEILERVRKSPRCGKIPVIVISSSDSPADRKSVLALGATEYFLKPSNLDEFMSLGKLIRKLHEQKSA